MSLRKMTTNYYTVVFIYLLVFIILCLPEVIFCTCRFRSPYEEPMCAHTLSVTTATEFQCATLCCGAETCDGYYHHSVTSSCLQIDPTVSSGDCSYYNSLTWKSWKKLSAPCYSTNSMGEYTGHFSLTISNITCKRWDQFLMYQLTPALFPDSTLADAANYCRDPTSRGYLWCHIDDLGTQHELCGMSRCECYTTDTHREYTGTRHLTKSGALCQRWDQDSPHAKSSYYDNADVYPDATVADAANYCRNPDIEAVMTELWCYTTNPLIRYETCDIQKCKPLIWQ